jgi:hypothetical protein
MDRRVGGRFTIATPGQVAMKMAGARVGVFGDPLGWEKIPGPAVIVAGILLPGSDARPDSIRFDRSTAQRCQGKSS